MAREPFRGPILTERHVQAVWYDAALRPEKLRTDDGTEVRVVHPGEWNLEAGPDFKNAVLEVGRCRRRLTGDVEIHLRASGWRLHGHASDPAYANVVAHVVWHRAGPRWDDEGLLPGGCLRICLGDFLRTRADFSPYEIDLAAYPRARLPSSPRPCEEVFARDVPRALRVLRMEGERRLSMKARRMQARFLRRGDRMQVFYEETMAAFGYSRNSEQFRALAAEVPWRNLPDSPEAAEAALECAAGMSVARTAGWNVRGLRPANSPARRIRQAALLFAGGIPRLMDDIAAMDLLSREGQRAAVGRLRRGSGIGEGRAAAIVANVVVPFALAEGIIDSVPLWMAPEDISSPVRLTALRLFGRDHNSALYSGNGVLIQGLVQVHRDFCLAVHPDCAPCPLGERGGDERMFALSDDMW